MLDKSAKSRGSRLPLPRPGWAAPGLVHAWRPLASAVLSATPTFVNFGKEKGPERPTTTHPRTHPPHPEDALANCQRLLGLIPGTAFKTDDTLIFNRFLFSWNQLTSSEAIEVLKNNFHARS